MSGIYIHIPFCKQACHYCDFHFSTNLQTVEALIASLKKELALRANYLQEPVETIYFGGGTPSILSTKSIKEILGTCANHHVIANDAEITIEVNPDDISIEKLKEFKEIGFNRLSIGIQSFDKKILNYLNRAHSDSEALDCLDISRTIGFEALSVDLIYGIPGRTHDQWKNDIKILLSKNPEHISAYCLTIEPGTAFGHWHKKGKLNPVDEEFAAMQFEILLDELTKVGYEQYEVSNFCRDNYYSKHNTAYWQQKPYLGIGPSAHSYNILSRSYNLKNNIKYIHALQNDELFMETEVLSEADKINDYLLTTLRTKWGCNLSQYNLSNKIDMDYVQKLINHNNAKIVDDHLILTKEGLLLADKISSDLFILD